MQFSRQLLVFLLLLFWTQVAVSQVPWVETKFPGAAPISGGITEIDVDAQGNIYAIVAESQARLGRSTNKGSSWQFYDLPIIGASVRGFEEFGGSFYLGTSSGLLKSSDLLNWQAVDLGAMVSLSDIHQDRDLLILSSGSPSYYAALPGSVFTKIPDSIANSGEGALSMHGPSEVIFLSKAGLWRSSVGSSDWVRISDGLPTQYRLGGMTVIGDSMYIGVEDGSNGSPHLFASPVSAVILSELQIQGGFLFKRLATYEDSILIAVRSDRSAPLQDINYSIDHQMLIPASTRPSNRIFDFALQEGQVWIATEGIWFSKDLLQTWEKASRRLETNAVTHLIAIPPTTLLATTSQRYVMVSTDKGDSWKTQSELPADATMLALSPAGTLLIGLEGKLLASRDTGVNFLSTDQGFERRTPLSFAVGLNEKLFLGTDSGMYYSTDDGATWFMPRSFLMNILTGATALPPVYSIAVDHRNNGLYVGTASGVVYSLDEGNSYESGWLRKSAVLSLLVNWYGEVFAGSYSIASPDPNLRNFYRGWEVLTSDPAWVGTDTLIERYDMDKLMFNSKEQLIAGVLFSHTHGENWQIGEIEGVGSPTSVNAQAIDADDIAYIAVDAKLYRSGGPKLTVATPQRAQRLSMYPNPATDWICFGDVEGEVTIINALGESVLALDLSPGRAVDIRQLAAGSYICQVSSSSGKSERSDVSRAPLIVVR